MDIKPGMKIPIFKIVTNGGFGDAIMTPGTFRPSLPNSLHRILKNKKDWLFPEKDVGYAFMTDQQIKLVGAMVVKKLKP